MTPSARLVIGRRLRRGLVLGGILSALVVAVAFLAPLPASAQFSGFDPVAAVRNTVQSNNWLQQGQQWAQRIYLTLMVFEMIALAVTALLFRDNLGEFLAGVGLKIVLGGVYFWFIANSGVGGFPGQIVATFTQFGQNLAGGNGNPSDLAAKAGAGGTIFFLAAEAAKTLDDTTATGIGGLACDFVLGTGVCDMEPALAALTSHMVFEFACEAMGMMIFMAIAAIYLEFVLITIESYIVMTAGTLFIGFAASRFTLPFSQGYFSYMMNVGVKVMVLYIVLGVLDPLLNNILVGSIGALAAAVADPTGTFIPAGLVAAAYAVLSVVIGAGLVWSMPGLCASFLSGQSHASGVSLLQHALSSFSGSAQTMAHMASSAMHTQNIAKGQENLRAVGNPSTRPPNEQMAPASVPGGGAESFQNAPAVSSPGITSPGITAAAAISDQMTEGLKVLNRSQRVGDNAPAVPGSSMARPAVSSGAVTPELGRSASSPPSYYDDRPVPQGFNESTSIPPSAVDDGVRARPSLVDEGDGIPPSLVDEGDGIRVRPSLVDEGDGIRVRPSLVDEDDGIRVRPSLVDEEATVGRGVSAIRGPLGENVDTGRPMRGSGGGRGLNGMSAGEIRKLSRSEGAALIRNTELNRLDSEQLAGLRENGALVEAIKDVNTKEIDSERRAAWLSFAYGVSGLQVPSEIGQPTAVEVHISNPDRL
jgi:hypothetical protein